MPLNIAYGNIYVNNKTPNKAINMLVANRPDSIGIAEGYNAMDLLRQIRQYRVFAGDGFQTERNTEWDTPILVQRTYPILLQWSERVSNQVNPKRIAPVRVFTVVGYKHISAGKVAHINIHPNFVAGATNDTAPHVKQYERSMQALCHMLEYLRNRKYKRVITGDVNVRENQRKPFVTAYDVFRSENMHFFSNKLDAIAWDQTLAGRPQVIPSSTTGSDHDFIIASFERI